MTSRPSVSVVISAKNEEGTVAAAVSAARSHCDEIIVMDGNSADDTAVRAREAGAVVIADGGAGKGAAVRNGLAIAAGEIVVLMDADGSHDPADVPRLVEPIVSGKADMVIGSRFTGGSDELSATLPQLIRIVGNVAMNIAINKWFGTSLTDTLNGFRALRRDIIPDLGLRQSRHTIEQEMVVQALRHGHSVLNIPTHEYARVFGQSRINIWREWPIFIWVLAVNLLRPNTRPTKNKRRHSTPESGTGGDVGSHPRP